MGLRILIADDEAIIRMGLRAMLIDLGHQVVGMARDGQEAIDLARQYQPDLAILDVRMPRMDGLDAAAAITEERQVPVVLLTAYSDRETVDRARAAAILAYLTKPVKEADLPPTIAIAQSRFQERRALEAERGALHDAEVTRDLVEQAKARLMQGGMSEPEAFRHIHYTSRRERRTMREVAQSILAAPSEEG